MAVQFSVTHSRTSEYRFLPQDITIKSQLNGRHNLPDIEWLVEDILLRGQVQPVAIRNDGGRPVLVSGFSRWRAISEINKRNLSPIPMQVRCTYVQCTEQEGFLSAIAENRFRNSTTPLDDAHNVKRLLNVYNMTEEQVAKIYFPTEGKKSEGMRFVKTRLALINLAPEMEKAFREGRLKDSAALAISKLSEDQQKELAKEKPQGKITARMARTDITISQRPKWAEIKKTISRVIETGKAKVNGKSFEVSDDIVEWLASLIGVQDGKDSSSAKSDAAD